MKLIHRSECARDPVRHVTTSGEIFVGTVVLLMLLAVLGDIIGPFALGEAGLEFSLFDMGGEGAVLTIQHWSLIDMMLAGGAVVLGISVIRTELVSMVRTLVSAILQGLGKIPI
ncbi:MAG: hypothetical protein AB7S57_17095 [Acetobacteraceae bacterium]